MGRHTAARWALGAVLCLGCALENPRDIVPLEAGLGDLGPLDAPPADQPLPVDQPPADLGPECGALGQPCCTTAPACREGACGSGGTCITCTAGEQLCDGRCVDLQSDNAHCGACGAACASDGATVCARGQCILSSCPAGRGDCNRDPLDGCETTLSDTAAHCGTCGNACNAPNGTPACVAGACQLAQCNVGFRDCDGLQSTGCEVNVARSLEHCGSCGVRCAPANAAAARCEEGRCFVESCARLFGDCNNDPEDGCETDLARSIEHCGACGTRCATTGGTPVCNVGVCGVSSCNPGRGDCDGDVGNGCETNLRDTVAHCGACGAACGALPHATVVCRDARCAIGACETGWGDCNGNPGDGCETDLRVTTGSCGMCGRACALPRAVPRCAASACAVASCEMGFGNCDNNPANGCEVGFASTLAHCGRCGNNCPNRTNATRTCNGGNCGFSCNNGFGNCDGNGGNGCEANLNNSMAHCGGCSRACTAPSGGSAMCMGGNCVRSCPGGQQNCGGTCRPAGACTSAGGGGCQTMGTFVCMGTNSACNATPRTSGGCSNPAGGVCRAGGVCGCPSGQTNCSGTCRNLSNTLGHCGACGRVCMAPAGGTAVCMGGNCIQTCPGGQQNCAGTCRPAGPCMSAGSGGCQTAGNFVCMSTNAVCDASPRTSGPCTSPVGGMCQSGGVCACTGGQTSCGGTCRTLMTDAQHCGACGRACAPGQTCAGGVCVCPAGQTACGSACVHTQDDPAHCGGCDRACMAPTSRCMGGMCVGG